MAKLGEHLNNSGSGVQILVYGLIIRGSHVLINKTITSLAIHYRQPGSLVHVSLQLTITYILSRIIHIKMKSSIVIVAQALSIFSSFATIRADFVPDAIDPSTLPGWPGLDNGTLRNGYYKLRYRDDGSAHRIEYNEFSKEVIARAASKRDFPKHALSGRDNVLGCDGFNLDHGDTDLTTKGLQDYCGNGKTETCWTVSGDVVSFFCLWDHAAQCTAASATWAWGAITGKCGQYVAGSVSDDYDRPQGDRKWSYGYTNWKQGQFCNIKPNPN
jgi:hypothetical protein